MPSLPSDSDLMIYDIVSYRIGKVNIYFIKTIVQYLLFRLFLKGEENG